MLGRLAGGICCHGASLLVVAGSLGHVDGASQMVNCALNCPFGRCLPQSARNGGDIVRGDFK